MLGKTVPYTLSFIRKKPLVRLPTSILRMRPRNRLVPKVRVLQIVRFIPMERKLFQLETDDPAARVYLLVPTQLGAIYLVACYTALRSLCR